MKNFNATSSFNLWLSAAFSLPASAGGLIGFLGGVRDYQTNRVIY